MFAQTSILSYVYKDYIKFIAFYNLTDECFFFLCSDIHKDIVNSCKFVYIVFIIYCENVLTKTKDFILLSFVCRSTKCLVINHVFVYL